MADPKFKLPPLNPPDDNTTTPAEDESGAEDNASKLARARALMAAVQDDQETSQHSGTGGGDMPVNVSPFVPADAANLPPAVQGQIAAQAGALASQLRANQIAVRLRDQNVATLTRQGDETSPFSVAAPQDDRDGTPRIVCANCGRSWEYRMAMAGGTIPCSGCAQLIEVPYPAQLRRNVPDAVAFPEAVDDLPEDTGTPNAEKDTPTDEGGEKGTDGE